MDDKNRFWGAVRYAAFGLAGILFAFSSHAIDCSGPQEVVEARPAAIQAFVLSTGKTVLTFTSNRPVGEWGQVFGDAVAATAILDRLLHHSQAITIRGDSYRRRDKRRSGLLHKAAAPTPITSKS